MLKAARSSCSGRIGPTKDGPLEDRILTKCCAFDAHPRMFADPQDDSNFHPRTWQRAARLGQVSFHRLQRGCAVGASGRMTFVSRLGQYDLVDTGRNFRVSGPPFEKP